MEKTYSLSHDLFPMRIIHTYCVWYICRYGYNFTYVRRNMRKIEISAQKGYAAIKTRRNCIAYMRGSKK